MVALRTTEGEAVVSVLLALQHMSVADEQSKSLVQTPSVATLGFAVIWITKSDRIIVRKTFILYLFCYELII